MITILKNTSWALYYLKKNVSMHQTDLGSNTGMSVHYTLWLSSGSTSIKNQCWFISYKPSPFQVQYNFFWKNIKFEHNINMNCRHLTPLLFQLKVNAQSGAQH